MMQAVLAVAANTIREARRNKIFYSIFFFAIAIILFSFLFAGLTIHFFDRILRNVGAGAIGIFGVMLAIFLGVGLVSREVDRRTVYTVVTKPIRRSQFLLGKLVGLMGILFISLGAMLVCLLCVLAVLSHDPIPVVALFWHFILTLTMLAILVSLAILISTFASSAMAAFTCVGVFILGTLSSDLYFFGQRAESSLVQTLSSALYYGLPNLARFNVTHHVTYGNPIEPTTAALTILYGLLYAGALFAIAVIVFDRRDFK